MKSFINLNKNMKFYLSSLAIYYFAMNLSGIFINIYLWKARHNIIDVAWYNMYYSFIIPIVCIAAGWIIKRKSAVLSYRIGIILEVFFYMLLLYLKTDSIKYLWLIGGIKGMSASLYAMGMHTMMYDFSKQDEYSIIFSYNSIFSNVSVLTAPLITGIILMLIPSQAGYSVVFSCSVLLYAASIIMTLKIHVNNKATPYEISELFRGKDKRRMMMNITYGLTAMKAIIISFLINLLLYIQTNSEFSIGAFSSLAGISSILIIYIIGRRIDIKNRYGILQFSTFAVVLSVAGLLFKISTLTILFYIILSSMFESLIGIVQNSMYFEVIKSDQNNEKFRVEYIINREFPIAAGRITGLLAFILFKGILNNLTLLKIVIFILEANYIWVWLILKKSNPDKQMN
ncbi:MAG: MFS transporter [Clostridiales bacterium]|nr:MFS transporter [Clostridiales bacterium]